MGLRGKKADRQFQYWNLRRKGMGQSEIARKYGVSRQSISKSLAAFERDVSLRLLEHAKASDALIEYYDPKKGLLLGFIPQVNNALYMLVIDSSNSIKAFYDPSIIRNKHVRKKMMSELNIILVDIYKLYGKNQKLTKMKDIFLMIIKKGGFCE